MSKLGAVIEAVEKHEKFVHEQVKRARTDEKFGREMTERWRKIKAATGSETFAAAAADIGIAACGFTPARLASPNNR